MNNKKPYDKFKLDTKEFIRRATLVHGNIYDYSLVVYTLGKNKVTIICRKHGAFEQVASSHIYGKGCAKCAKDKTAALNAIKVEEFIRRARERYGDKYEYDLTNYKDMSSYITVICPIHGPAEQRAKNHLDGTGCRKCGIEHKANLLRSNNEEFIIKANSVHNGYYNYDKVVYVNVSTNVVITCPIHGDFEQTPNSHLVGKGCYSCSGHSDTQESFIEKAIRKHGYKYDYSKVVYINSQTKVIIVCSKHGDFEQSPYSHLMGNGCKDCGIEFSVEKQFGSPEERGKKFIKKAKEIHSGFYKYNKVVYYNNYTKVIIICPKHGDFKQSPTEHLAGSGCTICSESRGERRVSKFLTLKDIRFFREYSIPPYTYRYDFYLPDYNLLIEYDGEQHFRSVEFFGGIERLKITIDRDRRKNHLAISNRYNLLRIKYTNFELIEEIIDIILLTLPENKVNTHVL